MGSRQGQSPLCCGVDILKGVNAENLLANVLAVSVLLKAFTGHRVQKKQEQQTMLSSRIPGRLNVQPEYLVLSPALPRHGL